MGRRKLTPEQKLYNSKIQSVKKLSATVPKNISRFNNRSNFAADEVRNLSYWNSRPLTLLGTHQSPSFQHYRKLFLNNENSGKADYTDVARNLPRANQVPAVTENYRNVPVLTSSTHPSINLYFGQSQQSSAMTLSGGTSVVNSNFNNNFQPSFFHTPPPLISREFKAVSTVKEESRQTPSDGLDGDELSMNTTNHGTIYSPQLSPFNQSEYKGSSMYASSASNSLSDQSDETVIPGASAMRYDKIASYFNELRKFYSNAQSLHCKYDNEDENRSKYNDHKENGSTRGLSRPTSEDIVKNENMQRSKLSYGGQFVQSSWRILDAPTLSCATIISNRLGRGDLEAAQTLLQMKHCVKNEPLDLTIREVGPLDLSLSKK